jgi:hypothetical protein
MEVMSPYLYLRRSLQEKSRLNDRCGASTAWRERARCCCVLLHTCPRFFLLFNPFICPERYGWNPAHRYCTNVHVLPLPYALQSFRFFFGERTMVKLATESRQGVFRYDDDRRRSKDAICGGKMRRNDEKEISVRVRAPVGRTFRG